MNDQRLSWFASAELSAADGKTEVVIYHAAAFTALAVTRAVRKSLRSAGAIDRLKCLEVYPSRCTAITEANRWTR